jgi:hypothetical protein
MMVHAEHGLAQGLPSTVALGGFVEGFRYRSGHLLRHA